MKSDAVGKTHGRRNKEVGRLRIRCPQKKETLIMVSDSMVIGVI